jgi:cysteine desulfurase
MKTMYLDFNASTPIAPEVAKAMQPFLVEGYGNPSSRHWAGIPAKEAVEKARSQVADLLDCSSDEVVFTSGGSESNNTALKGIAFALRDKGNHIITSQVEHPSVLNPLRFLEQNGFTVTYLPVDQYGMVKISDIEMALTPKTILITVMHANNEVGTIEPIAEIGKLAHARGVLLHADAAQSVGKISTRVNELNVDLLTIAGHKLYAPKGVGGLYVRRGVVFEPLIHGAGYESGRRAGTENVLLTVGLGAACELSQAWLENDSIRLFRDTFWELLQSAFGDRVRLNGHSLYRLPNTLNVSFVGRHGAELLSGMEEVAASTGSACHEGVSTMSPVLKAMGVPPEIGMGAVRFSLGRTTTRDEIDYVVNMLKQILN